jgi:hypothetical protein
VTKPIYPLHHIVEIHLFAVQFDLFHVYCLFPAYRLSRRERAAGNVQDYLEQQQVGFEGKCP